MKNLYRKIFLFIIFLLLFSIDIPAQNGWIKKADVPTIRGGASASAVNGEIYVIGGCTTSLTDLPTNEMYDPTTDTWEVKAPMPTARGFLFTALVNDTIYAIGGGYPSFKLKVEAYDHVTNTWTTKNDMPEGHRGGNSVCVIDDIIYIVGGNYNERECWAYNPATDIWTQKASLPSDGGGVLSVTAYNGLIYTFGGSTYSPWAARNTVFTYDPQTDTWSKKKDMPTARFALQTHLVNGKIYALGGAQYDGNCLSSVEVYDPITDTWETKPNMPISTAWVTGAVINDKIYVFGKMALGWGGGSPDTWEYDPAFIVPVELSSFTASANGKNITLNWSTATETNNYGFEIERSREEKEFYTIGFVNGKGTTTQNQSYTFTDNSLNSGKYYYRLKQIDYDGSYEYSDVVEVEWRSFDSYLLEQNYPNPFNPTTKIGFGIRENSNVRLSVFNSIGEEVAVLVNGEMESGFHEVEFNAANLPSGIYFYQLKFTPGGGQAGSFTQTKKLILMK
jgi:N-acetylneuraminic acid mutarotase